MATKRDYYELLGVARDAAEPEIKKAFASFHAKELALPDLRAALIAAAAKKGHVDNYMRKVEAEAAA